MALLEAHHTVVQKVFWLPAVCLHRCASFLLLVESSLLFRTLAYNSPCMVRLAGIEPARLAARDFKSLVSTYFTTVAIWCPRGDSNS